MAYTPIPAPTGPERSCKTWAAEAAMRMLLNNLNPEVGEDPSRLVVYGGTGKAARNPECLEAILASLLALEPDETLLVAVNLANVEQTVSFDPGVHVHTDATFEPLLNAPGPDIADDGTVRWVLPPISTSMVRVIAEE